MFDKRMVRDRILGSLMDTLDGMEAENLRNSTMRNMKKDFPGDSLADALGTHKESEDKVDDEKADLKNKIKS